MMLFDKLSDKEKAMIKSYIEDNAANNGQYMPLKADLSYILREWNANKSYLYTMLGHQFQISKDIEFEADFDELYAKVSKNCFDSRASEEVGRHSYAFYDAWFDCFVYSDSAYKYESGLSKVRNQLAYMLDTGNLISNVWSDASFAVPNPKNPEKPIRVSTGCKITKMIGKIAAAYDLPYFEDFRIKHSQALNQKKLKGRLTLSIHPLDYMTMSDNECDWSSCMSWKEDGCYRQGTVEMMNSPMVLVAYLESANNPMAIPLSDGKIEYWNSKKWRELFIVNNDIICEIKSYPYRNKYITGEVLNWLKELDNKVRSEYWVNQMIREVEGTEHEDYWSEKYHAFDTYDNPAGSEYVVEHQISVKPYTTLMYNDFCSGHLGYFPRYIESRPKTEIKFCYSGKSECMICGTAGEKFTWDSEGDTICLECSGYRRCDRCDDRIYDEDFYEVDGEILCESCYEYGTDKDILTGNLHLISNLSKVFVKVPGTEDKFYKRPLLIYNDDYDDLCDGECSFFNGKIKHQRYESFFWHDLDYITTDQLTDKAIAAIIRNSNTFWTAEKEKIDESDSKVIMDLYSDGRICKIFELNV